MSKDFDQAVQGVAERQAAPVAEAKKGLAPLRAEAEKLLHEFTEVAAKLRPGLLEAQGKLNQARAVGVLHSQLHLDLQEAFKILEGGPVGFKEIISRIDGLTEWDVLQRIPLHIEGDLRCRRGNAGNLEKLADAVKADCKQLTEILQNAAPSQTVAVVEPHEDAGVPVVHEFEPRRL